MDVIDQMAEYEAQYKYGSIHELEDYREEVLKDAASVSTIDDIDFALLQADKDWKDIDKWR